MPNHKSAEKRVRQNERKREVNRSSRGKVRTQIKKFRSLLEGGDRTATQEHLTPTISLIDKAVNKGILHKNTAARYKSRLTGHFNKLPQQEQQS
jgi:small subunit ribosomal protein S20